MRLEAVCGCGLRNFCMEDWLCHFRYRGFRIGPNHLFHTRLRWLR